MRLRLPELAVLATTALAALWGCASAPRPGALEVKQLEIQGAEQVKAGDIQSKILTSPTGWLPFASKQWFDPTTWQADLRRIVRYLQARGFYQAEIVNDEVHPDGQGGVALRVQVREGPATRISQIELQGLEALPPEFQQVARDQLELKVGDLFEELAWEKVKGAMQGELRERGFAEATVAGEAFVDLNANAVKLLLKVKPGIRYRFGKIYVSTNPRPKVRPAQIIEQAQGAIKEGHWYSESALAEAQNRVFQMGVFGAVKVNRGAPEPATGTVPVVVDVREAPFHTVRAGGGIGVDPTRQEVRAVAQYTNRNFYGGLRKFDTRATVGYAFLPSFYAVVTRDRTQVLRDAPVFTITNDFEQPDFFARDLRGQVSIELDKNIEQAYSYYGGKLRTGVIWRPHPAFSVSPTYNVEAYRLSGQVLPGGRAPALAFGCPEPCVLSYLEQQVQWDRRNDKLEPTSGYFLGISFQEGGGLLGGSFDYFRIQPEARYFASKGPFTLAAQVRIGTLIPRNGDDLVSPIIARFYSGGNEMRGFSARRLSPLLAEQVSVDPQDLAGVAAPLGAIKGQTVPIGGNGLFDFSFEVRYALTENLLFATFLDTGFVTTRRFDFADPAYLRKNMQYAVGIGLRYRTVVGPIRVDFAKRLDIGPPLTVYQPAGQVIDYPVDSGCFGIGGGGKTVYAGSPEGTCNLQISIGEAF
jgi:translocation and assembly module TamA